MAPPNAPDAYCELRLDAGSAGTGVGSLLPLLAIRQTRRHDDGAFMFFIVGYSYELDVGYLLDCSLYILVYFGFCTG